MSSNMSLLWSFKRLYSLDTLDTRFTHSSKVPIQVTKSEDGIDISKPAVRENGRAETRQNVHPSRWNTLEYYFYYFIFLTIVPLMFYVPYSISKGRSRAQRLLFLLLRAFAESHPQYYKFEPLLSQGWIFGRKVVSGHFDHV